MHHRSWAAVRMLPLLWQRNHGHAAVLTFQLRLGAAGKFFGPCLSTLGGDHRLREFATGGRPINQRTQLWTRGLGREAQ